AVTTTESTQDSTSTVDETLSHPAVVEDETNILKPLPDEQNIQQESVSSPIMLEEVKTVLPSDTSLTTTDQITSEEPIVSAPLDEVVVADVPDEDLTKSEQSKVETMKPVEISSPVAGYFSSSDVYHAYKQPIEPVLEKEPESPSVVEQVTNILSHIITDFKSHLPTLSTTETELISEPSITEKEISAPVAVDEEIIALKSAVDEQDTARDEASSTDLLETLKSYLPASMRSTEMEESFEDGKEELTTLSTSLAEPSTEVISEIEQSETTKSTTGTEAKESISSIIAGYFSSSDVYHAYKQPIEPVFEKEPESPSLVEQATNIVSHIISDFTSHLPTLQSHEEVNQTPIIDEEESTSAAVEKEIDVSKPTSEENEMVAEDTSSTGLLETLKSYLPTSMRSTEIDEITSELPAEPRKIDEVTVASSSTRTAVTSVSEEHLTEGAESEKSSISSPVAGYFSSSDVYHAYKQPIEPVFEKEPESPSLVEQATNIVSHIISDFTSHLPTLQSHEEVNQTPIIDEEESTSAAVEKEIDVSKPTSEENEMVAEDTSSTGLLETLKSYLPTSMRSTEIDEITSELPAEPRKIDEVTVASSSTRTAVTSVSEEHLTEGAESEKSSISSPVAGYFSSSDVYHAYKQPIEPVFEKEPESPSLVDQVTSIVSHIITDFTSHLPTLQSHEEVNQAPIIDEEKSTSEEKVIAGDDTSSTGLLETLNSYLPASLLSAEITSETPIEYTKAVEVTVPSPSTDTVATTATKQQIEKTENEL
ncbi:unnamed protein product, partial [Rotaria magnacalcarata]